LRSQICRAERCTRRDVRFDDLHPSGEFSVLASLERCTRTGGEIRVALDPDRGQARSACSHGEGDAAGAAAEIDGETGGVGGDERLQKRGVEAGAVALQRLEERHAPTEEGIHAVIGKDGLPVL
jgi:hypothetical protein